MIRNQSRINSALLICAVLFLSITNNSHAATYDELLRSYKAFYTDVDGDGLKDIYLKSQPQIILIYFEPVIPIDINKKPDYFLKAGGSWGNYSPPIEWIGPRPNLSNVSEWNILVGNTDNSSGTSEMLIQSADQGKSSVIASFIGLEPQNILYEAQMSLIEGQDISSEVSSLMLSDTNGDGRDDLVVTNTNTGTSYTLIANSDGTFGETVADEEVKIRQTWFGLQKALKDQDIDSATGFFSLRMRENYQRVFTDLRDKLPTIVQEFQNFYRLKVDEETAVFSINRTIDSVDNLFFIMFTKDSDGNWVVESL